MEAQLHEQSPKGSARLGSYLKRLRAGYGYSLRRVEERARATGGEIDNSQLSRYEKGLCYPSFDKLRVLASVFNVSIQSFSDVVDLEAYEELKPLETDPHELIAMGTTHVKQGDNGRAFACYERAIEQLDDLPATPDRALLVGEARVHLAAALRRLGKLALAEQELRNALRAAERLTPPLRARALLALANIHADQGDKFLAELEAERAADLAHAEQLTRMEAMALHTLAHVLSEQRRYPEAIERSRQAAELYATTGDHYEAIRIRINVGSYYVAMSKSREGVRLLRAALAEARAGQHRRLVAQAWSNLGDAHYRLHDPERARACFRESDALASFNDEHHQDILFFNAYYEWKMALEDRNQTRARIAFGRLKAVRPSLEKRFAEVEAFDEYVERGRSDA
jgi:tetratricopeptide (TPR) repeat protein